MNSTQFIAAAAMAVFALSGCSSKALEGKKIDYKTAGKVTPIAVPPDLSAPPTSDRYAIPENAAGSATYSEYSEGQGTRTTGPATAAVLPAVENVRFERGGSQRWLVVEADAETLWPAIREFWQDSGFLIDRELPEIGIMETDWAENRAKIPDSTLRKLIGKVLDQAYSYPERDKFRTRLEHGEEPGTTEIYVSHRGAYQVVVGERQSEQVKWQMRPTDPELEAEMLSRLMRRLGAKEEQAKAKPAAPEPRAQLTGNGETPEALRLDDSFDRAWRRVGLALDRVGFTVEDRDRSKGLYYVRYLDPDIDGKGKSGSGWSRLAFWRSDASKNDEQFRISVADAEKGTEVTVQNTEGTAAKSPTAGRILALLQQELK
ncbi:MAG TPA: outer membrane protein assembly factor BamC [Burkholderiales bacterium]|jgi:outer membrane protein assembly factor BamC|nr:outer membrane protein assembly factor BamC [Burkholderiales bacterium]